MKTAKALRGNELMIQNYWWAWQWQSTYSIDNTQEQQEHNEDSLVIRCKWVKWLCPIINQFRTVWSFL